LNSIASPLNSTQLNQTFGPAEGPKTNLDSIQSTLSSLREERSRFEAFLDQLDEKIDYGFSNEMEDEFEKRQCYKFPAAAIQPQGLVGS
jgi:hypothetical protein